jgi:parallel beta-helix repeat protein
MKLFSSAFLLFVSFHLLATNYYVDSDANYGGDGTQENPFTLIQDALDLAGPGDTVWIAEGVYYESYLEPNSGTSDQWIVIRNMPDEIPVINGGGAEEENYNAFWINNKTYIQITGLHITNFIDIGIDLRECGQITVSNCVLYENGSAGVGMNFALPESRVIVEDCICYNNGWDIGWASGIHINNKGASTDLPHIIRRNICYNNYDGSDYHTDGNGIMFDIGGGGDCIIENNVCFNNGGSGINVLDGNATVVNNTLFRNGWDDDQDWRHEIFIGEVTDGNVQNVIVQNNIIYARDGIPCVDIQDDIEEFVSFDNNLCWTDSGEDGVYYRDAITNTIIADPLFDNAPVDNSFTQINGVDFIQMNVEDYILSLNPESPAIDAAVGSYIPDHDIDGEVRPQGNQADLGAYEYAQLNSNDESFNESYTIYPNPAVDKIRIKSTTNPIKPSHIFAISVDGKVYELSLLNRNEIDVHHLEPGVYFLRILNDEHPHIKMLFVKQ